MPLLLLLPLRPMTVQQQVCEETVMLVAAAAVVVVVVEEEEEKAAGQMAEVAVEGGADTVEGPDA